MALMQPKLFSVKFKYIALFSSMLELSVILWFEHIFTQIYFLVFMNGQLLKILIHFALLNLLVFLQPQIRIIGMNFAIFPNLYT